ncbi:unnamed protein product [Phytophthora lilii]|uniref:Unnamed protein product n=1 Tax=Phytophthora lilii TaxID=2077276 RepID=A0A9W7CQ89_9STRA|nr:unnamed protein product [Phytophthora lilii]
MLRSTWFSLVSFTTVGYGDLYPRTSLGKMLDIIGMIFSSCYTAMPLTLVGGQFYVCYEIHAQEKRLRRRVQQRIKPDDTTSRAMAESMLQAFASSRDAVPNCEVVLPRLQRADARTESKAALDLVETINQIPTASQRTMSVSPLLSTVRDEDPAPTQQYTHSTEVQIISNFFLMHKVFHETIKDISLLNCLGIERVNTMRKNSSEAATKIPDVREREELIEAKISENMEFCVTACLNFAAMIERTLGTQHTRKRRQQPSIIQTNALLAAAELTSELLQPDLSVSNKSSKSNRTNKSIAAPSDPTPDLSESPSFTPTTSLQPKSTSLKRIATISKIFVGPILQSQRTQRAAKLAEFTNKKDQRHSSLTL